MAYRLLLIFFVYSFCNLNAQQLKPDSLEQIVRIGNDKEKSQALYQLGILYKYKEPEKAIRYFEQHNAISTADAEQVALSNQQLGYLYHQFGNLNVSKQYFLSALNFFSKTNSKKIIAEIEYAIAEIYSMQGNTAIAAEKYLSTLRYYEQNKDEAGLVNVYSSLANLYARQNNFSLSIEYNLKAISIYEKSSNKLQALVGYDQIGNAYLKIENYTKAAEYFNKSLKAYRDIKNNAGVAVSYHQLGNINYKLNKLTEATGFYQQSLQLAKTLNLTPLMVMNLNALGLIYLDQNKVSDATQVFTQASKLAKKSGMKPDLEQAYSGLEKAYQLSSEGGKAKTFASLSRELKDSLYNDSTLKKLTDMQLLYESEKKQRQIEVLSKEQLIRESELLRIKQLNRLYTYAGLAIGIALLILAYFFIQNKRFYRSLQIQQHELIQQKEKLDQLNKVKDRFFSIISHDLRNNLTTMKLYFDLISNPDYKPDASSDITKQISGSVENTIDLLENLLVWASSQIKGVPIHIQKLQLHSLVQENFHLLNGSASQKELKLINHLNEGSTAWGDMDMINLVLRNLLSNAIKFTPNGGLIEVNAEEDSGAVKISIKDNGVGISKDNLQKLFDQHLHPTTKGTGNEKGTGLGLLLCKDFIEKNGGSIGVHSDKNKGTVFYFTLPTHDKIA